MSWPNFLLVGAAKSGTTSLYHYLRQHPEIFMPEVKEPHYFISDRSLGFPLVSDRDTYGELFAGADQAVRGEASTAYLYFPEAAERIHAEVPRARIVALLRNPADRAFSMWGHQVREGLESASFEAALDEEERLGARRPRGVDFGFSYRRVGEAAAALERYQELFGRQSMFVGTYDELISDPDAFMRRLFSFLGVDPEFEGRWGKRHNASGKPRFHWLHSYLNGSGRLRRMSVAPLRWALSAKMRHAAWMKLREWNIQSGSRPEMAAATRRRLAEYYGDEIDRLEKLVGQDLSAWRGDAR